MPAFFRTPSTTSRSARPESMALATKMGAMMAVYQPSLAASRPKIHAVTECTRMAHASATTLMARSDLSDPLPPSKRSVAHRYAMERTR